MLQNLLALFFIFFLTLFLAPLIPSLLFILFALYGFCVFLQHLLTPRRRPHDHDQPPEP